MSIQQIKNKDYHYDVECCSFLRKAQRIFFKIFEIIDEDSNSETEKLENLKSLLKPYLHENPKEVLALIISINIDYNVRSDILYNLMLWIKENYLQF